MRGRAVQCYFFQVEHVGIWDMSYHRVGFMP